MDNLPKTLEHILNGLISTKELLSWNITGGNLYTQVSLRFAPDNMDTTIPNKTYYRKVPQSRIKRDTNRIKTYQDNLEEQFVPEAEYPKRKHSNSLEGVLSTMSTAPIANTYVTQDTIDLNTGDMNMAKIATSAEPQQPIDTAPVLNSETVIVDNRSSGCVCQDINNQIRQEYEGGQSGVQDVNNTGDESNSETEESDYDSSTICNICHNDITGPKWYRCTNCPDMDICAKYIKNEEHTEHKAYTHLYNDMSMTPAYSGVDCQSCGYHFKKGSQTFLYQCFQCIDYSMCISCKQQSMHQIHRKHLKYTSLDAYISKVY